MMTELKDIVARAAPTLAQDFIGCVALVVLLLAALHLPGTL